MKTDSKQLRDFGLITGLGFVILFGLLFPFLKHKTYPLWPWILAIFLILPAIFYPSLLSPLYKIWMKVGHILAWINTRIILSLFFFLVVTPMGVFMKILKKDPLERKKDVQEDSYRIWNKPSEHTRMEDPF